jgi:hypothetical protein
MKKSIRSFLLVAFMFLLAGILNAAKVEKEGKAWLGAHTGPATINVNGFWYEPAWGTIVLNQAEGKSELTGRGDNWDITGVVSGNHVYLLFSSKGNIAYSAVLTAVNDTTLDGGYSKGLMSNKDKGRTMHMTKRAGS